MASEKSRAVVNPNLGLYKDRPQIAIPDGALQDGYGFRIREGKVSNLNLGWSVFPTADGGNDPFTKILLRFNGLDANTVIVDNALGKTTSHVWVTAGNAQIDTAQSKFGGASGLFDGTGDWVTTGDHADYTLGGGDWTVDFWFNCNVAGGTLEHLCGQCDSTPTNASTSIRMNRTTGNFIEGIACVGSTAFTVTGTTQFTNALNTGWHHAAFVRTGDILRLFIDGIQEGGDVAITGTVNDSPEDFRVGAAGEVTTDPWTGWLDEFRLSVGVARWTEAFTPPDGAYFSSLQLNGPVTLIDRFFRRGQTPILIFGTPTDLYRLNDDETVSFITPLYNNGGTVSASGTSVTGSGTGFIGGGANAPMVHPGDEISFGSGSQTNPDAIWFVIANVATNTSLTLETSAGTVPAGSAFTIRLKFTGTVTDDWVSDTFILAGGTTDQWWATNGVQRPLFWDGTTTAVQLNDVAIPVCKWLRVYSNMMIYGNLIQVGVERPADIINSDINNPSTINAGLANQFTVHGESQEVLNAIPAGDALALYSRAPGPIILMQFVGDPLIFTFRTVVDGIGTIAARSVANFGDYHEFLAGDSQYRFDGGSVKEINPHIWRDVLRTIDPGRSFRIYHHFDDENGDLIWSVPLTLDVGAGGVLNPPETAVTEHYLENVAPGVPAPHSKRAFPFTAAGYYTRQGGLTWDQLTGPWAEAHFRWDDSFFFTDFPLQMAGDEDGFIYTFNTSQDGNGAALPSHVRFGRQAVLDGKNRGLVRRVYPFLTPFSTPMTVTVRLADHGMGGDTIIHPVAFDQTLPQGGHFSSIFRRGRYYTVEFSAPGPGTPYELSGFDVDVSPGGRR